VGFDLQVFEDFKKSHAIDDSAPACNADNQWRQVFARNKGEPI
jgi:hypothetical protein